MLFLLRYAHGASVSLSASHFNFQYHSHQRHAAPTGGEKKPVPLYMHVQGPSFTWAVSQDTRLPGLMLNACVLSC